MNSLFADDVLFWFYSTLAQVFAALLAIGGVFIIYKLQDQRNKIREAYSNARAVMLRFYQQPEEEINKIPDYNIVSKIRTNLEADKKKDIKGKKIDELERAASQIEKTKEEEQWIKKQRVWTFRLLSTSLILSVLLLPTHRVIGGEIGGVSTQYLVFVLILGLAVISILKLGDLIKRMIEGKQSDKPDKVLPPTGHANS